MCRRAEMNRIKGLKGLPWSGGAIGNAAWSGARLYDVLKAAGYRVRHKKYTFLNFLYIIT